MKYLCLIYDDESIWPKMSQDEMGKVMGEYNAFGEDIKASGHFIGGNALQPTSSATTVRVRNGKTITSDGPFAETKEQLGGYYLIDPKNQILFSAGRGLQNAAETNRVSTYLGYQRSL